MTAVSDGQGKFTLRRVAPGRYAVDVPAALGFDRYQSTAEISRANRELAIRLTTAAVTQSVTVVGETSQLNLDAASNRDQVSASAGMLESVPIFDQDYIATLSTFLDPVANATSGMSIIVDGVEMKGAGVSRNSLQTAASAEFDVRWSHQLFAFPAREKRTFLLAVDAFNVTNHSNYISYIGNIRSQFFAQPSAALPGRRLQFTGRIKF